MKQVVKTAHSQTTPIEKVDMDKIYAVARFEVVYKLQRICRGDTDLWMFCYIGSCIGGSSGVHSFLTVAIEREIDAGGIVYEFDTPQEFLEWALQQVSND